MQSQVQPCANKKNTNQSTNHSRMTKWKQSFRRERKRWGAATSSLGRSPDLDRLRLAFAVSGFPHLYSVCVSSAFGGEKWKTNVLLTAFLCPGYDGAETQFAVCWRYVRKASRWCTVCPLFLVLYLQISFWWIWSCGVKVLQQRCPLGRWWPSWRCGSASQCRSPSLEHTLALRRRYVHQ